MGNAIVKCLFLKSAAGWSYFAGDVALISESDALELESRGNVKILEREQTKPVAEVVIKPVKETITKPIKRSKTK